MEYLSKIFGKHQKMNYLSIILGKHKDLGIIIPYDSKNKQDSGRIKDIEDLEIFGHIEIVYKGKDFKQAKKSMSGKMDVEKVIERMYYY